MVVNRLTSLDLSYLYLLHSLLMVAPKRPVPKRRCTELFCAKMVVPNRRRQTVLLRMLYLHFNRQFSVMTIPKIIMLWTIHCILLHDCGVSGCYAYSPECSKKYPCLIISKAFVE